MAQYSFNPGQTTYNQFSNPPSNISNDNLRREYIGDLIYAVNPAQTPFFGVMSRFMKKAWSDPVIKTMEVRQQWQRRNFLLTAVTNDTTLVVKSEYDKRGKTVNTGEYKHACYFILPNSVIQVSGVTVGGKNGILTAGVSANTNTDFVKDTSDGYSTLTIKALYHIADDGTKSSGPSSLSLTSNYTAQGLVMGSSYGEGSSYGSGWADIMGQTEGYMQIFKTVNDMWTGTMMATEYRGIKDEAMRQWTQKQLEHKMDIAHAMLFGVGRIAQGSGQPTTDATDMSTRRYTWGVIPFLQHYGKTESFTYESSGYDDFVDFLQGFFDPAEGNDGPKLVLASRKIIGWINKLGKGNSFLGNTMMAESLKLDVTNIPTAFGFKMTKVNSIFGELNFIPEPLLRGVYENYAVILDPKNINYRYLVGNGINRDTHIIKDVQTPGTDGKIDLILTEAGMEILLPETHRLLVFS